MHSSEPRVPQVFPAAKAIRGLGEIAGRYDALLCDIWGVLHDGKAVFPGADDALRSFKAKHGPVVLISNSPRPHDDLVRQLQSLGVGPDSYSAVVSSGDATRDSLKALAPSGPCLCIGDARESSLYAGLGLDLNGTADTAAFIACSSPYHDETDTPEDYRGLFETCFARDLTMVCANPDLYVHRGEQLVMCAGALAKLYGEMGGKVIMAGKPHPPIYLMCYRELQAVLGRDIEKSRILAIGDGLPTDGLGASDQGLDLYFIASGLHRDQTLNAAGQIDSDRITEMAASRGVKLDWVSGALSW